MFCSAAGGVSSIGGDSSMVEYQAGGPEVIGSIPSRIIFVCSLLYWLLLWTHAMTMLLQ